MHHIFIWCSLSHVSIILPVSIFFKCETCVEINYYFLVTSFLSPYFFCTNIGTTKCRIKELSCLNVSGDAEKLQSAKLRDLHPASWFVPNPRYFLLPSAFWTSVCSVTGHLLIVAVFISRYCVAWYPVYRVPHGNFRASFLTYHSLGKLVPQICSPDSSGGQDTRIVCPAVGMQSYNDKVPF